MAKARLDKDGTAKPLTRIVHHPDRDHCVAPGMRLSRPEFEAEDGTRTPLGDGAEALAAKIRRARSGTEFEFAGHLLLVLDYEDDLDRQVKVSPHRDDVDRDALWLYVDEHLVDELKSLREPGTD